MKSARNSSMYRSGTMPISLPKISKLNVKQSRYKPNLNNRTSSVHQNITLRDNKSKSFMQSSRVPFTSRVQQQVFNQNQYPYIQTSNIQKQHFKLKDLLKQFNDETVHILQKYVIDKPLRKEYVKIKHPIQEIHFIRQKQAQNSTTMIGNLKTQIQRLQSRCQNLKYMSKEQFQQKIRQIKQQKNKMINQNKQLSRQITLNGLHIVRGKQSMVRQLEYEQFLIDSKRDRLKKQSQGVNKQINNLQQKIKQTMSQIQKYQNQQSYSLKQFEQLQRQKSQNRLYEQLSKRKKLCQHTKIINQSSNFQLKHKYFQKLKQLDEHTMKDQLMDRKLIQFDQQIQKSKLSIIQLQNKQQQYSNKKQNQFAKINYQNVNVSAKINVQLG